MSFSVVAPKQRAELMDKENSLATRLGLVSKQSTPKVARFEKGAWMKLLNALAAFGCFFSAYKDYVWYTTY